MKEQYITTLVIDNNNKFVINNLNIYIRLETLIIMFLQLDILDVSMLTSLKYLQCQGNRIKSLIIGELPNLTDIDCSHNEITTVNLTRCKKLVNIDCSFNKIYEIYLGKLTNLKTFIGTSNCLTELDMLECSNVETVNVEHNPIIDLVINSDYLTELTCDECCLNNLDLKLCPNLRKFSFGFNVIDNLSPDKVKYLEELRLEETLYDNLKSKVNLIVKGYNLR